jgi:hypothetical protein
MSAKYLTISGLKERFLDEEPAGPKYERMWASEQKLRARAFSNELKSPVEGLYLITTELQAKLGAWFVARLRAKKPLSAITEQTDTGFIIRNNGWEKDEDTSSVTYTRLITESVPGISKNFCLAGGQVLSQVIGSASKDADIFLVNPENPKDVVVKDQIVNYVQTIVAEVNPNKFKKFDFLVTPYALTMGKRYQIVFRLYSSLTQVLEGFDIGVCGFGYYNGQMFATGRALYELINQCIVVMPMFASSTYQYRLLKYRSKGFDLILPQVTSYQHPKDADLKKLSTLLAGARKVENYPGLVKSVVRDYHHSKDFKNYYKSLKKAMTDPSFLDRLYSKVEYYGIVNGFELRDQYVSSSREDYSSDGTGAYYEKNYLTPEGLLSELQSVKLLRVDPHTQADEAISFHPERTSLEEWYGQNATFTTSRA